MLTAPSSWYGLPARVGAEECCKRGQRPKIGLNALVQSGISDCMYGLGRSILQGHTARWLACRFGPRSRSEADGVTSGRGHGVDGGIGCTSLLHSGSGLSTSCDVRRTLLVRRKRARNLCQGGSGQGGQPGGICDILWRGAVLGIIRLRLWVCIPLQAFTLLSAVPVGREESRKEVM